MDFSRISSGKNPPKEINVVIEVPMGATPVKYEADKASGAIIVDRFLTTAMFYPCNYGFIPHSLSGDGDPADVLVITRFPVNSGAVIPARPIGVLLMEDESGQDEKILAVPAKKIDPYYADIQSYKDLPKVFLAQISHFFERYKDLEEGKWVKVKGWEDSSRAEELIIEALRQESVSSMGKVKIPKA